MKRLVAATLVVLAACGGGEDEPARRATPKIATETSEPTSEPSLAPGATPSGPTAIPRSSGRLTSSTPKPPSQLANAKVKLTGILEVPAPTSMRTGPSGRPWITLKAGRVIEFDNGATRQLLDISSEVSSEGERGLLGLAIAPSKLYVYFNMTNLAGDTEIREYRIAANGIDASSERLVMTVNQPYANHNGGDIQFGPDGHLYIALGDGGSAGDPQGNAQNLRSLLGKILRIVPRPGGGAAYGVPADNPFVGRNDAAPEVFHYGLRNPYRFSFDTANGDMWIGDVGQDKFEEIDWAPASAKGENFGWDRLEGSSVFEGAAPARHTLPVYEYPHQGQICSVTGGVVYHGNAIPALKDAYVFADYCEGRLRGFAFEAGRVSGHRYLGPAIDSPVAFHTDPAGEIYVLSLAGSIWRIDHA